jgi:L-2-hydroxycarboxylate dehydrogenase (NAD+)
MQADYLLLKKYVSSVFESIGCPEEDAHLAADVLVSADARGIDSHGVARLAGYVRLYDHGRLNPLSEGTEFCTKVLPPLYWMGTED